MQEYQFEIQEFMTGQDWDTFGGWMVHLKYRAEVESTTPLGVTLTVNDYGCGNGWCAGLVVAEEPEEAVRLVKVEVGKQHPSLEWAPFGFAMPEEF